MRRPVNVMPKSTPTTTSGFGLRDMIADSHTSHAAEGKRCLGKYEVYVSWSE